MEARLGERAAVYTTPLEYEPCGAVHFHAVSVGESMLALKLIREWLVREPERRFVLATGTATGHAVATAADIGGLRVTYAPLDFRWMVRRYLNRFEPSQIVLIEGEVWPHLLLDCEKRHIPVRLVNARMSARSARGYARVPSLARPMLAALAGVAAQTQVDAEDVAVRGPLLHQLRDRLGQLDRKAARLVQIRGQLLAGGAGEGGDQVALAGLGQAIHADGHRSLGGRLQLLQDHRADLRRRGLPVVGDDAGVFGCMSLLGCHDVCPKQLPLQTQIAFVRRKMAAMAWK